MRRLAVSLVCAVLIATVGAGWVVDRLFERVDRRETTPLASWRTLGRAVADLVDRGESPQEAIGRLAAEHDLAIEWLPRDALGIGLDEGAENGTGGNGTLADALDGPLGLALESEHGVNVYYALERHDALLGLSREERATLAPPVRAALTLLFYASVLALMLLWLRPLLARLRQLDLAAREFGRGRLERRVPARGGGELGRLEGSFNHMAARIENLIEDNRLLSSAVSHDLRTPLARLRFGVDALAELERVADAADGSGGRDHTGAGADGDLRARADDGGDGDDRDAVGGDGDSGAEGRVDSDVGTREAPGRERTADAPLVPDASSRATRQRYVARLDADVARMERLVEVLLEFTRLDARLRERGDAPSADVASARLDLAAVARRCCAELDADGRRLDLECDAALPAIDAHETHVSMLLANLLQNARRFGRERILVGVRAVADGVALEVEDDGEGIPVEDRERLRRPFERGARLAGECGYGLGLAIVERIAAWHRAELAIGTSERLGGARVSVIFEAAPGAAAPP